MHTRPTEAIIDVDALVYNYQYYKEKTDLEVFAVVKANAYGHGDVLVTDALKDHVKVFCVSSLDEALHLKEAGITQDILIFSYVSPQYVEKYQDQQFIYSAISYDWFEAVKDFDIRVHLKIDTGMNRVGIKNFEDIEKILKLQKNQVEGIYTHFSSSDDDLVYTNSQVKKFEALVEKCNYPFKWVHASNTHAAINIQSDVFNAMRLGIGLYGYEKDNHDLKKVMHLKTSIIQIQKIEAYETVGYNRTFEADEEMLIATLPIGYADGFDVRMKSVLIGNKKYPIVGKICMDQCMVRVDETVKLHDTVSLILDYEETQSETGIMPYILMTCISSRVSRVKKSSSDSN